MTTDSRLTGRIGPCFCLAGALLLTAVGCQRGFYDASTLPLGMKAYPVVDIHSLDLGTLASATATSQRIHAGDTLNMTVVTGAESRKPETWPLRVSEDGSVDVPLVGKIQLAGLDLQAAQDVVRNASVERGVYRQPTVAIAVDERQTNRVTVIGAVEEPGDYDLPIANCNLLSALSVAGGLAADAERYIEIRQPPSPRSLPNQPGGPEFAGPANFQQVAYNSPLEPIAQPAATVQQIRVDLVTATQTPASHGYNLRDGSVIMVRKRPPRYIHVLGLVNHPDQFNLPPNQNVRLLDALAMAGGRKLSIANRVLVVRQVPGSSEPALIELSITDAKEDSDSNLLLTDGDVVSVEETPFTMMVGAVTQFVRFGVNGSLSAF